ncbi:MAG: O-antigen ligase family protein [Bacteroidetes bacterium]|nr:O-antigen ligase family protein [Bacteroidota bacterium]
MTHSFDRTQIFSFLGLGALSIVSVLSAFYMDALYLMLVPFALLFVGIGIINFRVLYYLLLFSLPLSFEFSFGPSLGTDLPDEPLMIGMLLLAIVYVFQNPASLPLGFFRHVMILALLAHLFWILITCFTSINVLVSTKVFLSKLWYVGSFTVMTAIVVKTNEDLKKVFWCIYIPLTVLVIQAIIRHGLAGFPFDEVNKAMPPFFRNHVNYAAMLSIFLPFILMARQWYGRGTATRKLLNASVLLYVVAIYLSYTRTCYIAVLAIAPFIFVVKQRWIKPALLTVAVVVAIFCGYLAHNNNYLKFAPEFETTIYHDELSDHLASTFEGKDVSSMERVYRWIAIAHMFQERPVFGFGAGNFFPYYQRYTVTSFETYISDNEERSTAHNYFLLLLAEQGISGLAVFLLLTAVLFIYGENIYYRMKGDADKHLVLWLLVILAMVYVNLLLSDLLEADKVGPFFFIAIALLVSLDRREQKAT